MNGARWSTLAAVVFGIACADSSQPIAPFATGLMDASKPAPAGIRIIDLGTLGGSTSLVSGINTPGIDRPVLIVGHAQTAAGQFRASYWYYNIATGTASAPTALLTDAQDVQSTAFAANAAEHISGWSYTRVTSGGVTTTGKRPVRWTLPSGVTFLGDFGGSLGSATAITPAGRILGSSMDAAGLDHAFMWDPSPEPGGTLNNLGFSGYALSPVDVNKAGTIVGSLRVTPGALQTAFVWRAGVLTLLPDFGPPPAGDGIVSTAHAVNDSGVIVGMVNTATVRTRAVRWNPTAKGGYVVQNLDLGTGSAAHDINNVGEIVGAFQSNRRNAAFYLSASTFKELPVLSYAAGARRINERGDIVGFSYYRNAYSHAVLWTNVRP